MRCIAAGGPLPARRVERVDCYIGSDIFDTERERHADRIEALDRMNNCSFRAF